MNDHDVYEDLQKRVEKIIKEKEVRFDTAIIALQAVLSNIIEESGVSLFELIESQVGVHENIKKQFSE